MRGMNEEENKEIVRRFVDEVFVRLNSDAVNELVADDFRVAQLGVQWQR